MLLAASTSAQPASGSELNPSVPIKVTARGKSPIDVYYLVGESGAHETYTFSGQGPVMLTLFGPDGSEILTTSGSGPTKLEAVLPFTDVFTVAVSRTGAATGYELARRTTVPTLAEAFLSLGVGYAYESSSVTSCWVTPGVKKRVRGTKGWTDYTLAADRRSVTFISSRGKAGENSYSFEGETVKRTQRNADGSVAQSDSPFEFSYAPEKGARSTASYRCK
jgi:hypothetical protein